jgi:hypothetical protein
MRHNSFVRALTLVLGAALLLGGGIASAGPEASRFRVRIGGESHASAVGAKWVYSLRAVDARGRRVGGTAVVRVLVGGRVVDTLGWFGFKGSLRRSYRWAPEFAGTRAVLQVTVIGPGGTRTARHAVRVRSRVNTLTGRPAFRTILRAKTRTPPARARWSFSVRAFRKSGHPVGGTAVARVFRGGRIVDTIGWFGFRGSLSRTYRWPSRLRGSPAVFQVRVIGPGGTRTVGFAIRVR